jgi:PAS domain S-box-containing protein
MNEVIMPPGKNKPEPGPAFRSPYIMPSLIAGLTAVILGLNLYGLAAGITVVLPHLFYFPIILASYYYPRYGVPFSVGVSIAYLALVFPLDAALPAVLLAAEARVLLFVAIAAVVSYLSWRLQQYSRTCQRLVSVVESSSDAIIGKTLDGIITDWNAGAERLYGYAAGEAIGKPLSILLPPGRSDDISILLGKVGNGEHVQRYDTERMTRDGRIVPVSLSISPIRDDRGVIIGASSIAHDITGRKKLQDEILRAKNEWELTFDAVPDLIVIIDRNYRIVRINRSMADRLGIRPDEAVGRTCHELVHRLPHPLAACPHSLTLADGSGHSVELHEETLDGDFAVTVSPLQGPDGSRIGSVHVMHDITERKRVETAIHRYSEEVSDLYNNAPCGYHSLDANGIFVRVNDTEIEWLGYSRDELIGKKTWSDVITPESRRTFLENYPVFKERGWVHDLEFGMVRKDGSIFPVVLNATAIMDEGGNFVMSRSTIFDITERKRAEQALNQANQKLQMLSSITRHDILNQLMVLRGYLELLSEKETVPELVEFIGRSNEAAKRITRQVEFTRYYQDIGVRAPQWHDAGEVIGRAVSQLDLPGIMAENAVSGVEIYADPLIEKVFYNLIENSLRHGGHVSRISFTLRKAADGAVIMYRDDGVGISPEARQNLFTKGGGKHTGLGLFLSREILAITGIALRETGEPGHGVRFEILVPRGGIRDRTGTGP